MTQLEVQLLPLILLQCWMVQLQVWIASSVQLLQKKQLSASKVEATLVGNI
jgi:hypothetical protein